MELKHITIDCSHYPERLHELLINAKVYDSSSSKSARVLYVEKDNGYFVKTSQKGSLSNESIMMRYLHSMGLSSDVLLYISEKEDFLVTEKTKGKDCLDAQYLNQPNKLCDTLAENLRMLHSVDFAKCPIKNHTELYLATAKTNYASGNYDQSQFPDSFGYASAQQAYEEIQRHKHLLKNDTLLHGDYCLPNIILDNWKFSGFVDVGNGGVGDKHVDIFWAIWTLFFNLKTNAYRDRFVDAYGRNEVDEDILRLIAAIEVFG